MLLSLEDAREVVAGFNEHYNTKRPHSPIGCVVTLEDNPRSCYQQIFKDREAKLESAGAARKALRYQCGCPPLAKDVIVL
ncbi:integrase core domain-containing protein [Desulfolithobacter dissulfuricans]|uniref:integrase core domain-containing protein n=1 Tax=Desulfolithobacter dissulfuricans TaxID=2795293 RepID=UPI003EBBD4F1